ncbi:MAG TPA: adenine phosphoribosyltransferase [Acidimicrobiales bacterium]|nr:adenine phosphoribosyltransferase [Acidimicrobiales bacterium]
MDADGRSEPMAAELGPLIRDVVDHPSPGVVFKDITPLLADARALRLAVDALAEPFAGRVDTVAAIEARGFLLAGPVAVALGAGVVPLRKVGKLPWSTMAESYDLEYGQDSLEVHLDAVAAGHRVLVLDDVVATGGTAGAAVALIGRAGGTVVGLAALLEIAALGGRARLAPLVPEFHVLLTV